MTPEDKGYTDEIIKTPHLRVESITNADGGPLPLFEINDKGQIIAMHKNVEMAIASARSAAFEEAAKIVRENDANAVDVEKLILQHAKGDGK